MSKVNKNKLSRETNINNTIKSILLSNRELNQSNLKYNMFREVLKSDNLNEIMNKKTFDIRNLIIYYKDKINEDETLENAQYYFNLVEQIRIARVNKIVKNGQVQNIIVNKLKENIRDEEIEENWKNRNYTHFKLTNSTIEVKIEDMTQLEYQLKLWKIETVNNVLTQDILLEKNQLEKWILKVKQYALDVYNKVPTTNRNILYVGENSIKKEVCFLYYCLTDGKIHAIHRTYTFI